MNRVFKSVLSKSILERIMNTLTWIRIIFRKITVFIMLREENKREHADKLGNQISFPYMSALWNQPNSNGLETTPVKMSHIWKTKFEMIVFVITRTNSKKNKLICLLWVLLYPTCNMNWIGASIPPPIAAIRCARLSSSGIGTPFFFFATLSKVHSCQIEIFDIRKYALP